MATGEQPAPTPPSRISAWSWKAIENVVVVAASAAMVKAANAVAGDWIAQPWQAVWVLLPIAAAATLGWNNIRGTGRLKLDRRFALFLCIYVTLFSTAANFRFLDWNRNLRLFGKPAPPSRITPARFGDWRYALLPERNASSPGLVVIKMPTAAGRSLDDLRHEVAWFIKFANNVRAKGIAFDYYFIGESPFDREICFAIKNSGIPVFAGYRLAIHADGAVSPEAKLPGLLDSCMKDRLGHLAGFAESDERVRSVPLFLNNDRDQPALAWRVATALARDRKLTPPPDGLLRYIEPAPGPDFLAVTWDQLRENRDNVRMRLAERFLLVGEDSKEETFHTPFGDRLGVMIHAGAVDSLRADAYMRKSPWWSIVMLIMLASYAVAWPASKGLGLRWAVAGAAAATLACFVFAAAAAYAASVWVDVVYPALAAFLLVPLVTILREVPARAGDTIPANQAAPVKPSHL